MTTRWREPEPPDNVRIILRDGTIIPVECTYHGYHNGYHDWRIINVDTRVKLNVVAVRIDMLPPHTSVGFD